MAAQDPERSVTECSESDEVTEMYCEHCEKIFNKKSSAVGFCINCVEYMCDICLTYHKMYMCSHTLQDKSSMPQDFYFERCDVHKNQLIKFFCNNCEKTACARCKLKDHINCSNVQHLSSLVKGVEESKELKELFENIETFTEQVNDIETKTETKKQQMSQEVTKEVSAIEKHSKEAVAAFERQQQEIIDNFDKKMEETIARLKKEREILVDQVTEKKENFEKKINQSKKGTIKTIEFQKVSDNTMLVALQSKNSLIKRKLHRLKYSLVIEKSSGERCKIFLSMKKAQVDIQKVKEEADALKKEVTSFYLQQRHYNEHRLEFLKQLEEEL